MPENEKGLPRGGQGSEEESSVDNVPYLLESIIRRWHVFFNAKDVLPTSPAWNLFTPDFQMEMQGPSTIPDVTSSPIMNLQEFIRWAHDIGVKHPTYHIETFDHYVTINEELATVFVTSEIAGMPEGIVRPDIGIFTMRLDQGIGWRIALMKTFARPAGMLGEFQ